MKEDNINNDISLDEKDISRQESLFYDTSIAHRNIKPFVRPPICSVSTATDSFRCSTYSNPNYMTCPYINSYENCTENNKHVDGLREKNGKYKKCEEDDKKDLNYMSDNGYVDPYNIYRIEKKDDIYFSMFKNEESNIKNKESNHNNSKYPFDGCTKDLKIYTNVYEDSKNFSSLLSKDSIYHNSISNNHMTNKIPFYNKENLKNINNNNNYYYYNNDIKMKRNTINHDEIFKPIAYEKNGINIINKQTYDTYKKDEKYPYLSYDEKYNDMMIMLMSGLNIKDNYNNICDNNNNKEEENPVDHKNIQDVNKNENYFKDYISDVYHNLINENINNNKEINNINKYNIFNNYIDNDNINSDDNYIYMNRENNQDVNKNIFSFCKSNLNLKKENNNIYDTCKVFINKDYKEDILGNNNIEDILGKNNIEHILDNNNIEDILGKNNIEHILDNNNIEDILGKNNIEYILDNNNNIEHILDNNNIEDIPYNYNQAYILDNNNNIEDTFDNYHNDNTFTNDYFYNLKKGKKVSFDININKNKIIDHSSSINESYPFFLQNNIKDNKKNSLDNPCVDLNIYPNDLNEVILHDSEDKNILIDDDYILKREDVIIDEKENKRPDVDTNKNSIIQKEENIKDNINEFILSNNITHKNDYININNIDDEKMVKGFHKKEIFAHIKENDDKNNNNDNNNYMDSNNYAKNNCNTCYYNYNNGWCDKSSILSENRICNYNDIQYNFSSNYSNNVIYPLHNESNIHGENSPLAYIKDEEPLVFVNDEYDNKNKLNDMLCLDNCLCDSCVSINEELLSKEENNKKNIFENMKTYNFLCNLLNDKQDEDFRDNNNEYITSQSCFEENNNMNHTYDNYIFDNINEEYDNTPFKENIIYPENYNNILQHKKKDKDIIIKKKKSLAKYTLIVNVPPNTTRKDLMNVFSQFGNVDLTMVVCDKESRHPNKEWTATSGYSFVRFSTNIEARKTLTAATCGLIKIRGSKVRATWAKKDSYSKKEKDDIVLKIPSSILIINIQEFNCCICKIYLSYQPILFPCCFVSSCSDCLANYIMNNINQPNFKCPNCNIILNDKIIKLDKNVKGTLALLYKYYSNIKVKCPHNGCLWIGYQYQYLNHFISCKYNITHQIQT
ncbi:RNA-binding protein [Plasmodium falciparum NF54]|uniref:RNA-binding protein, putative n=2 Tax=Plasmodium falciparum TaxID=5833 RepID=Q8II44_PLAF7|nr:RNA-binding protein, putative [Plasmodium falciparum 3D7]EWC88067.1 hypothetical protein PFNF54_03297 [Plasmodium falciparum NF54]KAF4330957.1 RNA-binding protein [Plasmodium falciparum NF54]PKC48976.1 RNA-binding protein [Plasmodium falciparum NF54]CZT98983.1 RNA-binding protein, putative [Plasmodium falciparum 3D7]|eukprot:XP_001348001.1 conserved Plasmodium protein, unknown function [Plasmodium falciparum 3D7]